METLTLKELIQLPRLQGSYVWVCKASEREGVKSLQDWFIARISEVGGTDEAKWVYFQEEMDGFDLGLEYSEVEDYRFSAPLQEPEHSTI